MTANNAPPSTRQFHFLREIAAGGFGSVYLAKIVHADGFSRLAAIKLLHPKWSEHEEIVKRMRDEARLLGWLRHRNIVDVLDLTIIDGRCAVIMEYLEAVDLKMVVKSASLQEERIPMRVTLEIAAAVASALDAAYNRPPYAGEKPLRVIHRDIKPSNIMIDDSGTPKVLDFGVARADFDSRESHTQELSFGSLDYMPPERLFFEPETASSDIYSLGATLFELLALERMGKGKLSRDAQDEHVATQLQKLEASYPSVPPGVIEELADLLFEMLSFEPTERPSAAATVDRLRTLARKRREDPSISEWSETHVPPLVQALQSVRPDSATDPLIDSVLSEHSRPFGRVSTEEAEPESRVDPDDETSPGEELEDAVRLTGPEDDERWLKLKEATLAEISEEVSQHRSAQTFEIDSPLGGGSGLGAALTFEVEADESPTMAFADMDIFTEWEEDDKPTVVLTAEEVRMASLLENQVPSEWADAADGIDDDAPKAPAPPSLPASLRGRSAEVHTAPFVRPQPRGAAALPASAAPPGSAQSRPASPAAEPAAPRRRPKKSPPAAPVAQPVQIQEADRPGAQPAAAPRRSVVGMLVSAAFAMVVVVVFGSLGVVGGVVGIRFMKGAEPALAAAPAAVEPAPVVAAPPPVDESPLGPEEALFESGLADTKKLVVTCDGEKVSGGTSVRLSVGEGVECLVTAIGMDRSRMSTKLSATPGTWRCFVEGSEICVDPEAPAPEGEPEELGDVDAP